MFIHSLASEKKKRLDLYGFLLWQRGVPKQGSGCAPCDAFSFLSLKFQSKSCIKSIQGNLDQAEIYDINQE